MITLLLAALIGPGSELLIDDGYYPNPPERGGKWVALPTHVVVIGTTDKSDPPGCLVCVLKGDRPPYDGFYLVLRQLSRDRVLRVLRVVPGKLFEEDADVPIRR